MKRSKLKKRGLAHVRLVDEAHKRVEPDLSFWLEHVVHWHILLLVLIFALSFGSILFS
ncbi:MAG: hypothetical protein ABII13_03095 [Patescibacteria group bacterium]|nr:hypothetical protein [Patescibacteria group bacterium]